MADEEKKSSSSVGKIIATVFGAVLAPILVGVAVKWADPAFWRSPPASQAPAPSTQAPPPPPPTTPTGLLAKEGGHFGKEGGRFGKEGGRFGKERGAGGDDVVQLVTPRLGQHFYSFNWKDKTLVRHDPSKEFENFRHIANPPAIAVSGAGLAGLVTKKEYDNYELRVDFRWGEKTWPPRKDKIRLASILLHAAAPDHSQKETWPQSVAVLLNEGNTGGIRLHGPPGKVEGMARVKEWNNGQQRNFVTGDGLKQMVKSGPGATGLIHRLGFPENASPRQEEAGWRPPGDPTRPTPGPDDWNEVLIISDEGKITVSVNGKLVNEIQNLNLRKGHIIFTTDFADYLLGKIELTTLRK